MPSELQLSYTAAVILKAIAAGHCYGFEIMEAIGLPSGTVYPALRRMEASEVIGSEWESERIALNEQRPPRKYYKLTRAGCNVLSAAEQRYRLPEFATSQGA